jgi:hypothetical protein
MGVEVLGIEWECLQGTDERGAQLSQECPPTRQQAKGNKDLACHAEQVPCFHRTWDYLANSVVTG